MSTSRIDTARWTPRQLAVFNTVVQTYLKEKGHHIVLYDGVCLVCNTTINFIVDHDPVGIYHFAPLQSELGAFLLAHQNIPQMDSMILIEGDKKTHDSSQTLTSPGDVIPSSTCTNNLTSSSPFAMSSGCNDHSDPPPPPPHEFDWFCRSTAIFRIFARLSPQWLFQICWLLLLIPLIVRDTGYKIFAANRYKVFGRLGVEGDDESSSESISSSSSCRRVTRSIRERYLDYVVKDLEKKFEKEDKEKEVKLKEKVKVNENEKVNEKVQEQSNASEANESVECIDLGHSRSSSTATVSISSECQDSTLSQRRHIISDRTGPIKLSSV